MEELHLSAFFAGKELDVIDQQQIRVPIDVGEIRGLVFPDGTDEFQGEFFAGNVDHALDGGVLFGEIADGLDEVRFAQSDAAIDQQWIEAGSTWRFAHCQTCGFGKGVSVSFHEIVEGVPGVQGTARIGVFSVHGDGWHGLLGLWIPGVEGLVDGIIDLCSRPQQLVQSALDHVGIMPLQPLVVEMAGDLDGHRVVFDFQGFQRYEPSLEALVRDMGFDDGKEAFPDRFGGDVLSHLRFLIGMDVDTGANLLI